MRIQAFHLTKIHSSGVKVLDDASFSAEPGSFTAIVGESRTGKSTFLKMLGGEEKPTSGVLRLDHLDPYALSPGEKDRWLSEVGMVFPDLRLFPDKTVEENIAFILRVKVGEGEGQGAAIGRLLAKAGLGSKAGSKPSDLSSGEQRVVLALRAMIFRPKLLLADDPFQGLDEGTALSLYRLLAELNRSGSTIVLSTQPMAFWNEAVKAGPPVPQWIRMDQGKLTPLEGTAP